MSKPKAKRVFEVRYRTSLSNCEMTVKVAAAGFSELSKRVRAICKRHARLEADEGLRRIVSISDDGVIW
jgi:hypothetical protein